MARTRNDPATGPGGTGGGDGGEGQSSLVDPLAAFGAGTGGDGNGGTGSDAGTGAGSDTGTGKRPRKQRASKGEKGAVSVTAVESLLYSIHGMMAAALQAPEIALSQDEAKTLATAVAEVASHYDTVVDPKMLAWGNLAIAIGVVYGPRVIVLARKEKKTNSKKDGNQSAVSTLYPVS